ncbi:putative uncharacterized protein [Prevotella sp. CAG:1124]|nr:putative uncharacterized protein [Prevotella sp. CAG:1124]
MNKRIKTVWILSIATMALILCVQGYWLMNQYRYAIELNIEKLKTECTKAVEQEELYRFYMAERDSVEQPKTHIYIKVNLDNRKGKGKTVKKTVNSEVTYELPGIKRRVKLGNIELANGIDLANRYVAWHVKKTDKHHIDSLLNTAGQDTTAAFRFYKTNRYMAHPVFTTSGTFGNRLDVRYSTNPLEFVGVAFSVTVKPGNVLRSMAWQLVGSALLVLVLAFCMAYQIKTIIIQKRIDRIRHEFMKNMIYEMKQPPASEPTEGEAIKLGETDFFYPFNELRHGSEKVIITSRQAEILRLLAARKNTLVSREELLSEVWSDDSYANSMALNVQITYLRRALKADPTVAIEAVIKKGYILKVKK